MRDMTFRANFLIDTISSIAWMLMNLGLYMLIFRYTPMLGAGTGWGKYEFYLFLATTLLVNSTVQTFFMANADEFSELIRTGSLDFALLKPIDTQFLVSLQRIEWSSMGNFCFRLVLAVYALIELHYLPSILQGLLYVGYVAAGVIILYSLMISLAASSVWLGITRRCTISGSTSRISPAIRGRFTAGRSAIRCDGSSRSSSRSWWSSTSRPGFSFPQSNRRRPRTGACRCSPWQPQPRFLTPAGSSAARC